MLASGAVNLPDTVEKERRLVDGVNDHAADAAVWDGFLSRAVLLLR